MKNSISNRLGPLSLGLVFSCLHAGCTPTPEVTPPAALSASSAPAATAPVKAVAAVPAPATVVDPCAFPTKPAATPEETMWQIFVAANCPSGKAGSPLTWETWTEQTCLETPGAPGCAVAATATVAAQRHLHGSRLAQRKLGPRATPSADAGLPGCGPMTTVKNGPPELAPFVPPNLTATPTFCEEVFANAQEVAYIKAPAAGASLMTLTKQQAFLATSKIAFPTDAIEIKADWMPSTSIKEGIDCKKPPPGLHVEEIDGQCYGLVGLHISSKLLPDWIWATFEPQDTLTNPNNCNPKLYSSCNDPWGSNPATSTGATTEQTPAIARLMKEAKLLPAFANYRMVGAQKDFTSPTYLGGFAEFNAQVLPQQASCITCHNYAMVALTSPKGKSPENPNFGPFPATTKPPPPFAGDSPVGPASPPPLPAAGWGPWTQQDFSWMLGVQPVD